MKKSAFTLSEILITLAIVGIISVLTLPSMVGNFSTKANLATLKATYQQVGDALSQAMIDQGVRNVIDLEFDGDNNAEKIASFVSRYLEMAKDCGNQAGNCFAQSYNTYTGENVQTPFANNGVAFSEYVKLVNGASVAFIIDLVDGNSEDMYVLIDVNGPDKPNVFGKDTFVSSIRTNGSLGWAVLSSDFLDDMKSDCGGSNDASSAESCFELLKAKNWDIEHYLD